MPLVSTPAIVLATLRYGETSKIVRLATREHGIQSAMAKGALRPRSRYGAALQVLSEGSAQYIAKEGRELHTLTAFDVTHLRVGIAGQLDRYAAASAMSEVMLRLAPAAPHAESFDVMAHALAMLEAIPAEAAASYGLRALWHLVSSLGFAPALATCARDGSALPSGGTVRFSLTEGGILCNGCAHDRATIELPRQALDDLTALLSPGGDLPFLDARHLAAHRRLLARWVRTHLAEAAELPALESWQQRHWFPA
jgi:DNA repair protein RecO (recombination protein O)